MVGVSRRLSIEDYVDFFQNPQQHFLNKQHLNQVLSMHGYPKLNVPRSTLKENNTSASALLVNPDEIKKDLATIRWNEWSIDSVQIHRSGVQQSVSPDEEERQYSNKFFESDKSSSSSKTTAAGLNKKQVLTDIFNLPAAANLNSSNSKQVQAKKKISPDSGRNRKVELLIGYLHCSRILLVVLR
ncbi:hypothetical protein MKW98_010145 [Papaver atlanticum]|uniref:DUF7787 domain-containing protein n=1 Tax=Papaver atlanticum TaxID=357466 RepID=A0AAD4RXJ6_9MAGN|nr:hypothetical protein MKW98_010145 [Papaver atlanticum]